MSGSFRREQLERWATYCGQYLEDPETPVISEVVIKYARSFHAIPSPVDKIKSLASLDKVDLTIGLNMVYASPYAPSPEKIKNYQSIMKAIESQFSAESKADISVVAVMPSSRSCLPLRDSLPSRGLWQCKSHGSDPLQTKINNLN